MDSDSQELGAGASAGPDQGMDMVTGNAPVFMESEVDLENLEPVDDDVSYRNISKEDNVSSSQPSILSEVNRNVPSSPEAISADSGIVLRSIAPDNEQERVLPPVETCNTDNNAEVIQSLPPVVNSAASECQSSSSVSVVPDVTNKDDDAEEDALSDAETVIIENENEEPEPESQEITVLYDACSNRQQENPSKRVTVKPEVVAMDTSDDDDEDDEIRMEAWIRADTAAKNQPSTGGTSTFSNYQPRHEPSSTEDEEDEDYTTLNTSGSKEPMVGRLPTTTQLTQPIAGIKIKTEPGLTPASSSSFATAGPSSTSTFVKVEPQIVKNEPSRENSPVENPFHNLFADTSQFYRLFRTNPRGAFDQFYQALLTNNIESAGTQRNQQRQYKKSVESLWGKTKLLETAHDNPLLKLSNPEDDEDEEDDELGVAETYADYTPAKLKIGNLHPDPVVETASLASVVPPEISYDLHFPARVIDEGKLSSLQLESITYCSQQHENMLPSGERAGFLIGDGAGVGKGRTIAGIIHENYLCGRKKAIWVSISADLLYDSDRDLQDIGAKIAIEPLNKMKYGKIEEPRKGIIFTTYSSLIGKSTKGGGAKYNTRLKMLLAWCGKDFDGVIVFDEAHRAKNLFVKSGLKPTKTGLTVLELQKELPNARIVYASATGASEPANMAYMVRLGIWGDGTPFAGFPEFLKALDKRGVGAMEIVAMDMKLRGAYIARQLSFKGVTFKIEEAKLTEGFQKMYDEAVALWVELLGEFQAAADTLELRGQDRKTMWGQFWGSHQRFFKYLCNAPKVNRAVELTKEAVADGKCVVIGLQCTGEARTVDQLEKGGGQLDDFVSSAEGTLEILVRNHFPSPEPTGSESDSDLEPVNSKRKSRKEVPKSRKRPKYTHYTEEDDMDTGTDSDFIAEEGSGSDSSDFQPSSTRKNKKKTTSSAKNGFVDDEASDDDDGGDDDDEEDETDYDDDTVSEEEENRFSKKKKTQKKPIGKKTTSPGSSGDMMDLVKTLTGAESVAVHPTPDEKLALRKKKKEILEKIRVLGKRLPRNTLDELIEKLGGATQVAEMTGRKGRVIWDRDEKKVVYESRCEPGVTLETINLKEKDRFQTGRKMIAIISEAASSGISLQADRRAKNQAKRFHITLELPWAADRAVQQFGRTHRSNQVVAPEYVFLISELAGENRFASIVAKRLESLGALTHGDRRATEVRDLSRYNFDTKYGKQALKHVLAAIKDVEAPIVQPKHDGYESTEKFFEALILALEGVGLDLVGEDTTNMTKFLNRILGLPVKLQNGIFDYFCESLSRIVKVAKRNGEWEKGIQDLGPSGLTRIKRTTYDLHHFSNIAKVTLYEVKRSRGMTWEDALTKYNELTGAEEGFYLSTNVRYRNQMVQLVVSIKSLQGGDDAINPRRKMYHLYKPHMGYQDGQKHFFADIDRNYKRITVDAAKKYWEKQFEFSNTHCIHQFQFCSCKRVTMGWSCDYGLRNQTFHVLAGSVLMVWQVVERVLTDRLYDERKRTKVEVCRIRDDVFKSVGILIPNSVVEYLMQELDGLDEVVDTKVEKF